MKEPLDVREALLSQVLDATRRSALLSWEELERDLYPAADGVLPRELVREIFVGAFMAGATYRGQQPW